MRSDTQSPTASGDGVSDPTTNRQYNPGPDRLVNFVRQDSYAPSHAASVSDTASSHIPGSPITEYLPASAFMSVKGHKQDPSPYLQAPSTVSFEGDSGYDDQEGYWSPHSIAPNFIVSQIATSPRNTLILKPSSPPPFAHWGGAYLPLPPVSPDSLLSTSIPVRWDSPLSEFTPHSGSSDGRGRSGTISRERRYSDATLFPRVSVEMKRPESKGKKRGGHGTHMDKQVNPSHKGMLPTPPKKASLGKSITNWIRSLREIPIDDVKGEGQMVKDGCVMLWNECKQLVKEAKMQEASEKEEAREREKMRQTYPLHGQFKKEKEGVPGERKHHHQLSLNDRVRLPLVSIEVPVSPRTRVVPERNKVDASPGYSSLSSPLKSLTVPVKASSSIKYDVELSPLQQTVVDKSKPLPPVPRIEPAPKTLALAPAKAKRKGPGTLVFSPPSGKTNVPVGPMVPSPSKSKLEWLSRLDGRQETGAQETQLENTEGDERPATLPWVRKLLHKLDSDLDQRANKHTVQRHNHLKSQISQPTPMIVPGERTANVAAERGGVGGPTAAIHPPINYSAPMQRARPERKKYRHKPKLSTIPDDESTKGTIYKKKPSSHWRDLLASQASSGAKTSGKSTQFSISQEHGGGILPSQSLGRRRKGSDTSFACQGIDRSSQQASSHALDICEDSQDSQDSQDSGRGRDHDRSIRVPPHVRAHSPTRSPQPGLTALPALPKRGLFARFQHESEDGQNELIPDPLHFRWKTGHQTGKSKYRDNRCYTYYDLLHEYEVLIPTGVGGGSKAGCATSVNTGTLNFDAKGDWNVSKHGGKW